MIVPRHGANDHRNHLGLSLLTPCHNIPAKAFAVGSVPRKRIAAFKSFQQQAFQPGLRPFLLILADRVADFLAHASESTTLNLLFYESSHRVRQ